jgi:hypothetical protein
MLGKPSLTAQDGEQLIATVSLSIDFVQYMLFVSVPVHSLSHTNNIIGRWELQHHQQSTKSKVGLEPLETLLYLSFRLPVAI